LDAAEKLKMVVKYVDLEMRRLWKAMDGYGQDYNLMKTDILASYLKITLGDQYMKKQLLKLVEKASFWVIDDEKDLLCLLPGIQTYCFIPGDQQQDHG
jgi:hypothetical protein